VTETVVIGAGVFGSWCAWRLAELGHRVTLLDAYGAGNGRASSTDHSRVIRAGYGVDAVYSQWATDSRRDWDWLAQASQRELVTTSGALFLGEPGNDYVRQTAQTLATLGLRADWIEPGELRSRFPQIAVEGLGTVLFEPDAGAIRAKAAVRALVMLAQERASVTYRTDCIEPLDESRSAPHVVTSSGKVIEADVFIVACGPWLPKLLPLAVGSRLRPTRQEVLYFGVPPASRRFAIPELPIWIDFAAGFYGVPDLDAQGFKVGVDRHGPPIDPDTADRVVGSQVVHNTRGWIARRFPELMNAPLVDARVCQYENTSTGDFIIDRHPAWSNLWIVGGGSGHGFKHGPAVARHVAALLAGDVAPQPRFALESKSLEKQRAVF
jgi:glycine/D-amino acid oxidase-like deaminating enzyme